MTTASTVDTPDAPRTPSTSPRALSVALLECDHVDPDVRGIAGDYGDMFRGLFARHAPEVAFDHVDVVGGDALPDLGRYDGIVITGSRRSVGDDLPWIHDLIEFVGRVHRHRTPLVGICFGHQLIAHALGGRVDRAPVGWGVGVHHATVTAPRAWMSPSVRGFDLLVSHQDQVTAVPSGGTVLATSDHAPVAAFEIGSLLGFQGHPEFVADYAEALMARRIERIGIETIDRARATLSRPTDHATVARWISHFIRATRDADRPL